ncbi:lipolytic enzyme, GDSL family [Spiroplasma gladiatoris]|uniref:Lipolytic enzyme, GDSL family n=1 Tax=Spiroplasma gladiatoris TaxID=2143 RepID=A0A4P7AHE7_9MOLU|nr:SGNH/GDSL hydrolase family protein [Spiroplasma gladiatoris]QBQ07874.1 lipolytic enzyme, GDSL family [Spiroplasma gladiatoris]
MKKLITLLSVLSISTSTGVSAVSCMPAQADIKTDFSEDVGKNIDKSNAKDTSVDPSNYHGVSNFYTLGDSLSDNGGLVTIAKDELNANVVMTGQYKGGFSNGPRTAEIINEKLGFKGISDKDSTFKSSNLIHKADIDYKDQKVWGRNYSVGGATAYESDGLAAKLLMGNTGIYKQAQALVQQQVIKEDDLFFLEIGGNDLFALAGVVDNVNAQTKIMNNAIENISNAFYTLLNNGAKKIVFASPPDITLTPGYNKRDKNYLAKVNLLCKEFDYKVTKVIEKLNSKFNNAIKTYNLYQELKNILNEFKGSNKNINITDHACKSNAFDLGGLNIGGTIEIKAELDNGVTEENVNNYFFIDDVHPTKSGHEFVSKKIWDLLISWNYISE